MKLLWILISCFLIVGFPAHCQKTYKVKGEARVRVENTQSKLDARSKAKELAIINAIEKQFGTYVEQDANIYLEEGQLDFRIVGNTKVRGEWLKTLNITYKEEVQPIDTEEGKSYQIWIACQVIGKARELPKARASFISWPLNCPEKNCKSAAFYHEQPFYLYFQSPVAGQLSVFLEQDGEVYRLLPYQDMPEQYINAVPVSADQEYIFFHNDPEKEYFKNFDRFLTDELVMTYEEDKKEYATLYIVFSVQDYLKPVLDKASYNQDEYGIPKSLDPGQFYEWLENNRLKDINFVYRKIELRITSTP